jgi:hypothetical protein
MPVIPALRRLRQEDYMLKASLDYIVKHCSPYPPKKKKGSALTTLFSEMKSGDLICSQNTS